MCEVCNPPEADRLAGVTTVRSMIDASHWATIAVEPECGLPTFAYTVGLSNFGLPELVISGMRKERALPVLDPVAARILLNGAPAPGRRIRLPNRRLSEIVRVDDPAARLQIATDVLGPRFTAIQLVYADKKGRWPWDNGYRGRQAVLGDRG